MSKLVKTNLVRNGEVIPPPPPGSACVFAETLDGLYLLLEAAFPGSLADGTYGVVTGDGSGNYDVLAYQLVLAVDGFPLGQDAAHSLTPYHGEWLPNWFTSRKTNPLSLNGVHYEAGLNGGATRIEYQLSETLAQIDARWTRFGTGGSIVDTGSAFRISGNVGFFDQGWVAAAVPATVDVPRLMLIRASCVQSNGTAGIMEDSGTVAMRFGQAYNGLTLCRSGALNVCGFNGGPAFANYGIGVVIINPFDTVILEGQANISISPPSSISNAPSQLYMQQFGPDPRAPPKPEQSRLALCNSGNTTAYFLTTGREVQIRALGGQFFQGITDVQSVHVFRCEV